MHHQQCVQLNLWPMLSTPDQCGYWWNNAGWTLWIPSTTSDVPREGQLSNRMQDFLQHYDVMAIGEILKSRHITTIQDLQNMKNNTKADIHSAAQFMYTKILGNHYFNESRRKNLEAIFYVPMNSTAEASGHCEKKPKDTELKQELQSIELMEAGSQWFGPKMMECRHLMGQSESLARLSVMLAVQAYMAVIVPEPCKPAKWTYVDGKWVESEEMAEFKALRATIRDVISWRLIGFILGIDRREPAESILSDALRGTVSDNPKEDSPYAALLHAFLMIKRDVMRTMLLAESRQEKICRAAGLEHAEVLSVPAGDVTKEFLEIKALMIQVQQQTAKLQTEVDQLKVSRAATAEEYQ